jgi:hypothetical protein
MGFVHQSAIVPQPKLFTFVQKRNLWVLTVRTGYLRTGSTVRNWSFPTVQLVSLKRAINSHLGFMYLSRAVGEKTSALICVPAVLVCISTRAINTTAGICVLSRAVGEKTCALICVPAVLVCISTIMRCVLPSKQAEHRSVYCWWYCYCSWYRACSHNSTEVNTPE